MEKVSFKRNKSTMLQHPRTHNAPTYQVLYQKNRSIRRLI